MAANTSATKPTTFALSLNMKSYMDDEYLLSFCAIVYQEALEFTFPLAEHRAPIVSDVLYHLRVIRATENFVEHDVFNCVESQNSSSGLDDDQILQKMLEWRDEKYFQRIESGFALLRIWGELIASVKDYKNLDYNIQVTRTKWTRRSSDELIAAPSEWLSGLELFSDELIRLPNNQKAIELGRYLQHRLVTYRQSGNVPPVPESSSNSSSVPPALLPPPVLELEPPIQPQPSFFKRHGLVMGLTATAGTAIGAGIAASIIFAVLTGGMSLALTIGIIVAAALVGFAAGGLSGALGSKCYEQYNAPAI